MKTISPYEVWEYFVTDTWSIRVNTPGWGHSNVPSTYPDLQSYEDEEIIDQQPKTHASFCYSTFEPSKLPPSHHRHPFPLHLLRRR